MSQDEVLTALRALGRPARGIEIMAELGLCQASVSGALRRLEKYGEVKHITIRNEPGGGRMVLWEVTADGH